MNERAPSAESYDAILLKRVGLLSEEFATSEEGSSVSDFWRRLVTKHLELLKQEGFAHFKRTLNFEYSQWCVTVPVDPKLWLMHYNFVRTLRRVPALWRRTSYQPGGEPKRWPIPSPGAAEVYKTFVSTLWEYVKEQDDVGILDRVQEPALGNPIRIYDGDTLVSQDLALSALEINRIAKHTDLRQVRSVLEIGGGYGRLAYVFKQLLPDVEYHIVDIPPTLAVSELYLSSLLGPGQVHFHLPAALKTLPARHFDLVINVSSFDEMKESQAHAYLRAFAEKGRGTAYIKGHGLRKRSTGRRGVLEFDYPSGWVELYRGGDPFKSTFNELVFRLP